jgi:hypothetical protein
VNNPLIYTDPDGEYWHIIIGAAIGGVVNLAANWNNIDSFWDGLATFSVGAGAGALTAATGGSGFFTNAMSTGVTCMTNSIVAQTEKNFSGFDNIDWGHVGQSGVIGAANGALSTISPIKIPFGNSGLNLTIAPQFAVGTDGFGIGANAMLNYNFGKGFNAGLNFGGAYYASAAGTGASSWEGRFGYGIGYQGKHFQAGIGSTYFFSGETSQQTGQMYVGGGNWRVTYENDTWAPVPGLWSGGGSKSDKFRTAALRFDLTGGRLKGLNAGLSIFTGKADKMSSNSGSFTEVNQYRLGAAYIGYRNMRVGYNSEKNIRGPVQNGFHNLFNYPHFEVLNMRDRLYFGIYSLNPYTLW